MTDRFGMTVQAVVTLTLLGFAYLMESKAPGVSSMVVGAVLTHWFKEASAYGRRAANAGTETTTTETTGAQ